MYKSGRIRKAIEDNNVELVTVNDLMTALPRKNRGI